MPRRTLLLLLAALPALSTPAAAQPLRDRVRELFTFGSCGDPLCLTVVGHGQHFIPDLVQGQDNMIAFLGSAIGASVANVPVSAGSGGATFTFRDGRPVRTSVSAGPVLGERAQTLGRGRFLAGFTVSSFQFRTLRGTPLRDLEFNFKHANVGDSLFGVPAVENDVIQVRSDLEVDLWVGSFFLTAGLGDWMDLGVVVPLLNLSMRGRSHAQVIPFGSDQHHFDGGLVEAQAFTEASARGVGDVAVRAKITLHRTQRSGMALLADVRLPTGDEENFLGTGEPTVRALAIVSGSLGGFSPHLNVGYRYRTDESSVLATAGFDHLVTPAVTLALDVVSEWQVGDGRLNLPAPLHYTLPAVRTLPAANVPDGRDDIVSAALGVKVLLRPGLTAVANSVVPVLEGGMQPRMAFSLGLETNF